VVSIVGVGFMIIAVIIGKNCLRFLDFSFGAFTARNRTRVHFSPINPVEHHKLMIGFLGVPFFLVGVNSIHCRRGFSDYRGNHRKKLFTFS
jgi:hypothetical protein